MEHTPPTTPPTTEPARAAWIKYQLELRGLSMADVSRMLGFYRNTASKVLSARYPLVEARIASLLGLRPEEIWPERYESGRPIRLSVTRPTRQRSRHVAGHTTRRHGRKSSTTNKPTSNGAVDDGAGEKR